ncbi:MAG: polyprenyl synthetase family protein [bacterium]
MPLLDDFIAASQERVNAVLDACLPEPSGDTLVLHQAMRYSVLNGGKRLRPVLAYAAAEAVGGQAQSASSSAAAIELIHAYSLIHDDLPAMDDDDFRRGKPTCHKVYGDAMAILAGDALQALAFEILSGDISIQSELRLSLISHLSKAAGARGMVAGQAIDIGAVNHDIDLPSLRNMHGCKTGALIRASVVMGATATGLADSGQLDALARYGDRVGLAFQIQDDILDIESDTETLGKAVGADLALNKPTFTSLLGLEKARSEASRLRDEAIEITESLGDTSHLAELADYIVSRNH